jgi:hypothetical protein
MSYLTLNSTVEPQVPAAGKISIYADNSIDGAASIRAINPSGNNFSLAPSRNFAVLPQTFPTAAAYYIAGSALQIPGNRIQLGSAFSWRFPITKTAAGVAASTYTVLAGTHGSLLDPVVLSFTKPAGTAAVDEGVIEIIASARSIGVSGVLAGEFLLDHFGAGDKAFPSYGHLSQPCVRIAAISGAIDMTVANLLVGIAVTTGAADVITAQFIQSKIEGI